MYGKGIFREKKGRSLQDWEKQEKRNYNQLLKLGLRLNRSKKNEP